MNIVRLQGDTEKRNGIYYEYDVDAVPLGEGGMGRVFKGFRIMERTGERIPVAIKAIYDNIPERVVERARREAEIQLDNDNLIRMYGFVETVSHYEGGTKCKVHYHVIMELLVGVTLENIMNGVTSDHNGMQIPFAAELYSQYSLNRYATVVRIMKSILSGLMALHDKGYIHRDIDPSNIMITIDGKIKLIDFGICKQIVSLESLDKALTATGVFMGKVNYAAPELVLGDVKSQSYTTDIYALGILLYQLCSGHLPFSGTDQDILSANLRSSLPMKDIKGYDFRRIIRKATEKMQSKRYASAAEFRVDLERVSFSKPEYNIKNIATYIGGAVISLIVLIGTIMFSLDNKEHEELVEVIVEQPTSEELFNEAMVMLSQKDSIHLQAKGEEQLRSLAEDSMYLPAQMKYYVMMINSSIPENVEKGYNGLERITQNNPSNTIALFECGLTLSKGNSIFNVPTMRQRFLRRDMDLEKANDFLYKSMNADVTDYKSPYWILGNLIEMKLAESDGTKTSLPSDIDYQMVELYKTFERRVENHNDATAEKYKQAIIEDKITLWNWGLIK